MSGFPLDETSAPKSNQAHVILALLIKSLKMNKERKGKELYLSV